MEASMLTNHSAGVNNPIRLGLSQTQFENEVTSSGILTTAEAWGWAFLFVTIINMSSVMGIIFFPLMKKSYYTLIMRMMIGLAIGSLSGSSLFHLIPAAFDLGEKNDKGQSYINIALFIWLSMWIVMLLECTIKIVVKIRAVKSERKYQRKCIMAAEADTNLGGGDIPLQISSQLNIPFSNGNAPTDGLEEEDENNEDDDATPATNSLKTSHANLPVYHSTFSLNRTAIEAVGGDLKRPQTIKTVAWLIIIGDSLHNFIDGVSIGAAFVKDFRTGAIISMAIMCEEFPHELGDFAILISSGFSVKKALLVNFLSALTCYLGMGLGILLGEIHWSNYIFAFASGIFLYVSLADMVPEITSLIEEVSEVQPKQAWSVLLTHNIGILTGITILYALAAFQPK
ncbi:zinc transporter ZIP6 [Folsomia candida]|uniref:zinc transporter ZIP6 n=1 Tax=Folsomia candida TaxID=158441 RepID=UPI000B8FFA5F|nr:zinc transporter ZIP6 [Folsomia candida]